ncbi:uncharacterized protein LOC107641173 [Arachis ipaensis]|uniref:uncharacterized protein LOC107641173 n=1 Tax=Arachis ipaensis TaxID=130454 RepID=UPI0007AEEBE9|nr:uncharacterized protein LOC107641173 [Arachis ipaensis]
MVGPVGMWIRWFLARLNGRGLGRAGLFKWMPFGTLIANVSAACVMAALSTVKEAVNTKDCDTIVIGTQLGLLGCLSTVSTFAAEFNAMKENRMQRTPAGSTSGGPTNHGISRIRWSLVNPSLPENIREELLAAFDVSRSTDRL